MRNLSFVSLFLISILLSGCSTLKPFGLKPCQDGADSLALTRSPYKDRFDKLLFKASLDIRKEHLTGLLLVKRMPDSTIQIGFANEIGMTFFTFIIREDGFEAPYVFEPMNRKPLISIFRTCFELMLEYETDPKSRSILCNSEEDFVSAGSRSGRYKAWSTIYRSPSKGSVLYGMNNFWDRTRIIFSDVSNGVPQTVSVSTPMVGLEMELKLLSF